MNRDRLIAWLVLLALALEAWLWLAEAHRQIAVIIALLWITSLMFPRKQDDDWAF